MIWTLAWKEYREQRAAWLILAALAALVMVVFRQTIPLLYHALYFPEDVAFTGGIVLSIYGLVSGALMFANEREADTLSFLDSVCRRRISVWTTKVLVGLVFNVCLALWVLVLLAVVGGKNWHLGLAMWASGLFLGLGAFSWGLVGSALGRTVLAAIGWTFATLSIGFLSIGFLLFDLFFILLARGAAGLWFRPWLYVLRDSALQLQSTIFLVAGAAISGLIFCRTDLQRKRATQADKLPLLQMPAHQNIRALRWLVYRQGRPLALLMVTSAIFLGLFLPGIDFLLLPFVALAFAVICGAMTFADEQQSGAGRFLGEQRLPLGRLWFVKNLLWFCAALALMGVAVAVGASFAALRRDLYYIDYLVGSSSILDWIKLIGAFTILLFCPLQAFAIGQLLTQGLRKPLIAIILTVFFSILVLAAWLPSVALGMERWKLYVVPFILLAAARLNVWTWANGQLRSARGFLLLEGSLIVSIVWIAGCLWFRVAEVPAISEPFDRAAFLANLPKPEQNRAGRLVNAVFIEFPKYYREVEENFAGRHIKKDGPGRFISKVVDEGWQKDEPWIPELRIASCRC